MMPRISRALPLILALGVAPAVGAQTPAPSYLATFCNALKPGSYSEMIRNETAWARALEKLPGAVNSLGLTSMSGPSTVCWLTSYPSMAAMGKHRAVAGPLDDRFEPATKGYAETATAAIAVLRSDLSFGEPNVLQKTMLSWYQIRVRPGSEAQFVAAVKALAAARKRAGLTNDWRVYQVLNGAAEDTWWVLSSQPDFASLDKNAADDPKFIAAVTPDDMKAFNAFWDRITASRNDLWVFNSAISSFQPSDRAQNAFWKLRAAPAK